MGGDGGSIPGRQDLVRTVRPEEKKAIEAIKSKLSKWKLCAVSGEQLKKPAVCDYLGNVFNKEALLVEMVNKTLSAELAAHIGSVKRDVVDMHVCLSEDGGIERKSVSAVSTISGGSAESGGVMQCPIAGVTGNSKHDLVCLRDCGCVVSVDALLQVPSESCLSCAKALGFHSSQLTWLKSLHTADFDFEALIDLADASGMPLILAAIVLNPTPALKDAMRTAYFKHIRNSVAERERKKRRKERKSKRKIIHDSTFAKAHESKKRKRKRAIPEEIDRTVEAQKKKSKVFASLFG